MSLFYSNITFEWRPNCLLLETGRIIDAKKNQPPSWGGFLVRKGPTTGERGRLHSVTDWQFHKYQSVMDFLSNQHFRMWPSNRSFVQCAAVMTLTFIWIAATCISILTFTHFSEVSEILNIIRLWELRSLADY